MSHSDSNRNRSNQLPRATICFLACFLFAFILGSLSLVPYNSDAAETKSLEVDLDVASVIALTTSTSLVNLQVSPLPGGVLSTANVIAAVSTNNPTGYTLNLSSQTSNNQLIHTDTTTTVPSTTNTTPGTPEPLASNTWGYRSEPGDTITSPPVTNFLAIPTPTPPTPINSSLGPIANDPTIVTFGAKIDTSQKAGLYSSYVTFSAVTNYVPPLPLKFASPSSGLCMSSAAIDRSGDLWVWGYNWFGELGIGATGSEPIPINLSALPGNPIEGVKFKAVAFGMKHALAIDSEQNLWTWGRNYNGELGDGTEDDSLTPINISALPGNPIENKKFKHVSAGNAYDGHSIAIDTSGHLWVWGSNSQGKLGNNSTDYSTIPINLSTLSGSPVENLEFKHASAGGQHTVALDTSGHLWTWGQNGSGQLGNSTTTGSLVPINLSTLSGSPIEGLRIQSISAGSYSTYAIDISGHLWSWGGNSSGQLGNSTTTGSLVPINLSTLTGNPTEGLRFQFVASDYVHAAAIDTAGHIWTWGWNRQGQIGNGVFSEDPTPPINLSTLSGNPVKGIKFQSVATANNHTLALDSTGYLWAWGENRDGELGNDSGVSSPIPLKLTIYPY